jgi:hypothetical protein
MKLMLQGMLPSLDCALGKYSESIGKNLAEINPYTSKYKAQVCIMSLYGVSST